MMTRRAEERDLASITAIYNQGIEDRIATLETDIKSESYTKKWLFDREERYAVVVAEENEEIVGWASINSYSPRSAYRGVGEISIYVRREYRGKGIGQILLAALEAAATHYQFYKLVLFTFPFNHLGQGLYRKSGYREVGVFEKQGILEGEHIDVMIMEKLL
ncbi:arsinothricin resistance N-acetyltransferase ArsN1 family A [Ectobacillus funiculus]|uniref:Arsinothricin resistance N-acetyltransferase ArsN1 family A n=1 Tax=Ectobacillus funiculus TaxID=137993 RepID=A0ABV5WG21_9BACI